MSDAKFWKAGVADEVWKISICARDASATRDVLSSLIHYLTKTGNDTEQGIAELSTMSGAQIVDGLRAYHATALKSIENGIAKMREVPPL